MIHFDSPVVVVKWRADLNAVELAWKGFAKGNDFRNALDKGLELVKLKGAKKWLGDTSQMAAIPMEDQKWVNEDWFPRLLKLTVTSMAVIQPKSLVAKMSVDNIISKVGNLEIQNFSERTAAETWLKSK